MPKNKNLKKPNRLDPEKLQLIWAGIVTLAVGAAAIYHTNTRAPGSYSTAHFTAVQQERYPAQNLDENILHPRRSDM